MQILITGATGFIGHQLVQRLDEHQLTLLSRNVSRAKALLGTQHQYLGTLDSLDNLDDFDAVINLAGESVTNKRWSTKQKETLCQSRWLLTQTLVDKIKSSNSPPSVLINGSAIGIYGRQDDQRINEDFCHFHPEFSHKLCARWEEIALRAQSSTTRVCILRTGIVLGNGGALAKMLPPFKWGLGGRMANGHQGMSWIHIDDMVDGTLFLLNQQECEGIYNLTAPNPVSNQEFTQALASVLHMPAIFPMPGFIISLLFGEMGELFRYGQFVVPEKLQQQGFRFHHPELRKALENVIAQKK